MPPTGPGWAGRVLALSSDEAMELFDTALMVDEPFLAPARIDLPALRAHALAVPPMFAIWSTRRPGAASTTHWPRRSRNPRWRTGCTGCPKPNSTRVLLDLVRRTSPPCWATHHAEAIDPDKAFQELGFDSLTAVEMRNRLKTATGLALSPTLIFDYPTPNGLASYIRSELAGVPQEIKQAPAVARHRRRADRDRGDGVPVPGWGGFAGRPVGHGDPGPRRGLGIPGDRGWDLAGLYNPDPDVAGTCTPAPAASWTASRTSTPRSSGSGPARRWRWIPSSGMFLELSWEALERAGIDPAALRGSAPAYSPACITPGLRHGLRRSS